MGEGSLFFVSGTKRKNNNTDKTNGEFLGKGCTLLIGLSTGSLHVTTEVRQSRNFDRSVDFGIGSYESVIRFLASHQSVEDDPPVGSGFADSMYFCQRITVLSIVRMTPCWTKVGTVFWYACRTIEQR